MIPKNDDTKYRNSVYAIIFTLFVAYAGYKYWHVSLAIRAFEGQEISTE